MAPPKTARRHPEIAPWEAPGTYHHLLGHRVFAPDLPVARGGPSRCWSSTATPVLLRLRRRRRRARRGSPGGVGRPPRLRTVGQARRRLRPDAASGRRRGAGRALGLRRLALLTHDMGDIAGALAATLSPANRAMGMGAHAEPVAHGGGNRPRTPGWPPYAPPRADGRTARGAPTSPHPPHRPPA